MADYPLPPWLSPQAALGWGQLAGEAARARLSANLQRDRMAQQSAQFAIEANQRSQQMAQENQIRQNQLNYQHLMEQQRLAIDQSYKQQVMDLNSQRLELATRNFENRTQQAAKKFAAGQSFQQAILPKDQGGEGLEASQAALKYLAPYMTGTEAARLASTPHDFQPGATFAIPNASGEGLVQVAPNRWEKYATVPQTITNAPAGVSVKDENGDVIGHYVQLPGEKPHYQPMTKSSDTDLATLIKQRQEQKGGGKPAGRKTEAAPPPKLGEDETIRTTRDGKQAVFNTTTHQFVRWVDQEPANAEH